MNPIIIIQGNDVDIPLHFTDSTGANINLTGCTVFFTAKKRDDAGAVISKTITTHTTPLQGITTLSLSNTETQKDPGDYIFDIKIKDTSNKYKSCNSGIVTILGAVTKRTTG